MDLNTKNLKEKIERRMVALDEQKADFERKIADIGRQKQELRGSLEAVKTVERHAVALDNMVETGEFDLGEDGAEEEEAPESETLEVAEDRDYSEEEALKTAVVATLAQAGGSEEEDEDLMMVENLFAPGEGPAEAASGNGNEPTLESVLKEVDTIGDSKGPLDVDEKAFPEASNSESIVPKFLKKYL